MSQVVPVLRGMDVASHPAMTRCWLALSLVLLVPACSGSNEPNAAGGVGGTAGSDSGTLSAADQQCLAKVQEAVFQSANERVAGFLGTAFIGESTITAVTPTTLEVAGGVFRWVGPDLTHHFEVGNTVELGSDADQDWHWIASEAYTAAAFVTRGMSEGKPEIPDLPYPGPELRLVPECEVVHEECSSDRLYAVEATSASDTSVIEMGESSSIAGWIISNAGSGTISSGSNPHCNLEPQFGVALTALIETPP